MKLCKYAHSILSHFLHPIQYIHHPGQRLSHSLSLTITGDVTRCYECQSGLWRLCRGAIGLGAGQEAGDCARHRPLRKAIHTPIGSELHHPVRQCT